MYRFLIIDDEPVVREGISENIDWNALGFELVGACRDGREGLAALERLKPDVVLTDICMPFVDGLELAAWIGEQYPATKTILLTGYDEFEYAQEAVRLRVHDFLLKPITADELREMLGRIRSELDDERNRKRRLDRLQEQLRESLPLLRERFLNRLVRGPLRAAEARRRISFLDLNLPGPAYTALICDPDSLEPDDQLSGYAVQKIVEQTAGKLAETVTFSTSREDAVVLFSASDEAGALSRALECAEQISDRIKRELGRSVSVGVGDPVTGLDRVPESYRDARTALERRLVLGPGQVITVQQLRGAGGALAAGDRAGARARYVRSLKTGSAAEAEEALRHYLGLFRRTDADADACYVGMHRLLADALNALESLGLAYDQIPDCGPNPFEQLGKRKTLADMENWFIRFHCAAGEYLERRQQQHSQRKAVAAEEFIREHYGDPQLSLRIVCNALSVSKSYLSPIFKARTGMTFVEYLTAVRMERARDLIASDDLRSYEVAERVGFKDAHYFSLTFKKQTGFSPTGYREQARQRVL